MIKIAAKSAGFSLQRTITPMRCSWSKLLPHRRAYRLKTATGELVLFGKAIEAGHDLVVGIAASSLDHSEASPLLCP